MTADLAQFFHIVLSDVWAGRVPVRHVLLCVGQLGKTVGSRVRGDLFDDPIVGAGFDATTTAVADLHDLIAIALSAFGNQSPSEEMLARRPHIPDSDEPDEVGSLADFDFNRAMQRMTA